MDTSCNQQQSGDNPIRDEEPVQTAQEAHQQTRDEDQSVKPTQPESNQAPDADINEPLNDNSKSPINELAETSNNLMATSEPQTDQLSSVAIMDPVVTDSVDDPKSKDATSKPMDNMGELLQDSTISWGEQKSQPDNSKPTADISKPPGESNHVSSHDSKQIDVPHNPAQVPDNSTDTVSVTTPAKVTNEKKKEDEKLGIYKALAIKLKKELVKTRDELQRLREEKQRESCEVSEKVKSLEDTLIRERNSNTNMIATLEANVKHLKFQLESCENDLKSVQIDFENYKTRATKIMQENHPIQSSTMKPFEEERYKQLRALNQEFSGRIKELESKLTQSLENNAILESEKETLQEQVQKCLDELKYVGDLDSKCSKLVRENENLRNALKQYSEKTDSQSKEAERNEPKSIDQLMLSDRGNMNEALGETAAQLSPNTSLKDDCNTNSSSSYDGSTSGYVHIKPTTFEIISRSSLLEDAQNQIDSLTKAYLDSESTNSLLSEQVKALKEEIRRIQRGAERMDLAENLEYLKNVVFKFISLDNGQSEQKQQLVPVLSTVLRLSPDETAKLNSIAMSERTSMANTLFKFSGG